MRVMASSMSRVVYAVVTLSGPRAADDDGSSSSIRVIVAPSTADDDDDDDDEKGAAKWVMGAAGLPDEDHASSAAEATPPHRTGAKERTARRISSGVRVIHLFTRSLAHSVDWGRRTDETNVEYKRWYVLYD